MRAETIGLLLQKWETAAIALSRSLSVLFPPATRAGRHMWLIWHVQCQGSTDAAAQLSGGSHERKTSEDVLKLPKNARTFALEVRGDSMIDAQYCRGRYLIMELRDPTHRDIVAALIGGETTLKRFLLHNGKPFLRAENSKYRDLIPAHELVIKASFGPS